MDSEAAMSSLLKESESKSKGKKHLIDLESIIKRWAKREYKRYRSCRQRLTVKSSDLDFKFNWKDVRTHHVSDPSNEKLKPPKEKAVVLFEATFENRTSGPQNYSFQTERTTSSTCSIEVEKGVVRGVEATVTLKAPGDVFEASAGFKEEISVTETKAEQVVEELKWSNDGQITVPKGHKTTAKLIVNEKCFEDNIYIIRSHFYGDIKVDVYNRRDNSHLGHIAGDIVGIIDKVATLEEGRLLETDTSRQLEPYDRDVITYETKGRTTYNVGVKQEVRISEEELD